ncbi:MAG: hypothetical protein LR001_02730 [Clostridiales bacterium]|nr:hypothetical protein [Clostridiales bacterium]
MLTLLMTRLEINNMNDVNDSLNHVNQSGDTVIAVEKTSSNQQKLLIMFCLLK